MIEWSSACGRVNNTWSILLENSGVSFNGDRNWLLGNGGLELGGRVWWNCCVWCYLNLSLVFWFLASLGHSSVDVGTFKVFWFRFSVDEGVWLPSSLASVWSSVAINELLFGEGKKSSSLNEVSSFNGSSSWECPAWSALSLIFNWVDCSLGSPVDWSWNIISWKNSNVGWFFHLGSVSQHFFPFSISVVSEVVDSNFWGGVSWVSIDGSKSLFELSRSEFEFGFGSIWFSVFGNKSNEFVISLSELLSKEELSSLWGLVVEGNKSKSSGGSNSNEGCFHFQNILNYKSMV